MENEFTPAQLNTELNNTPTPESVVVVNPAPGTAVVAADYVTCDFCKCKLTPTGHVYEISETSRDFRDGKETHRKDIAKKDEEISRLNAEIATLSAKLREVQNVTRKANFL
jgi:hypothetical protein